jgi:hypothetical protein
VAQVISRAASFVADRAKYWDTQNHEIICSVALGVVVGTTSKFPYPRGDEIFSEEEPGAYIVRH